MVGSIEPIFVSIDDGARAIGVKRTKFYSIVNEGRIPLVKIGRKSLVSVESLKSFAATLTAQAA